MRIAILQFGLVNEAVLEEIRRSLSEIFPHREAFVLRDVLPLPDEAYNPIRGQYHSSKVLSLIQSYPMKLDVDRILGITEVDLYVPRLNFVFGEASPYGTAIISLFRLRPEFYGEPFNHELFFERASKEAIHEIGHTLGIGHCRDPRCVMFFSNSIFDTDRKMLRFCRHCKAKISNTT
ncbi:MAG: archaemetzincin family Zn-dependent metalloprotease [Candidatus Bathyarchaeia archaeon]